MMLFGHPLFGSFDTRRLSPQRPCSHSVMLRSLPVADPGSL
jgi:hypothetical protein